jgi:transposase
MMGQHARSEALFYYFKLEEYIPENHWLRLIDKHISLAFVNLPGDVLPVRQAPALSCRIFASR